MAAEEDPPAFVPTNITVGEFLVQYEDAVRDTMKRRSFETYLDIVRLHVLPALRNTKLKDLTRKQVQRMYARKRDEGLSAARVRRIHGVLSSALNHALRWRLVEHNVCKEVSPPRVPPPEIRPFSLDEAKRFLATAQGDRFEALYVLGMTSGMRLGELGGLFWSDVDLARRVLYVQRALITGHGGRPSNPRRPRDGKPPWHLPDRQGGGRPSTPQETAAGRRVPGRGRRAGVHEQGGQPRQPLAPALPLV